MIDRLWSKASSGDLQKLENSECITEYNTWAQSRRGNLLWVTDREHREDLDVYPERIRLFGKYCKEHSYWSDSLCVTSKSWVNNTHVLISGGFITGEAVYDGHGKGSFPVRWIPKTTSPQEWVFETSSLLYEPDFRDLDEPSRSWPVKYCLSEAATQRCKLEFSTDIAIIVTCLNFRKFTFSISSAHGLFYGSTCIMICLWLS